jgi:hypothetical protein
MRVASSTMAVTISNEMGYSIASDATDGLSDRDHISITAPIDFGATTVDHWVSCGQSED